MFEYDFSDDSLVGGTHSVCMVFNDVKITAIQPILRLRVSLLTVNVDRLISLVAIEEEFAIPLPSESLARLTFLLLPVYL